jgi:steroid delta-isomerase-like uncharacterized protein
MLKLVSLNVITMAKLTFVLIALTGLLGAWSSHKITSTKNPQQMTVTVQTMKEVLDAFNRHDLDAIMEYFSDDCSFDFPRGPEPFGQRFVGKANVREGLALRFKGIPDVHYGDDQHWISADGSQGVSEWTLTGTTTAGVKLNVRGCDLWEFRNGKIIRKNSYWKIVEQGGSTTK